MSDLFTELHTAHHVQAAEGAEKLAALLGRAATRVTNLEAEVERLHGVSGEYLTALEEANSENDALEARVAELTSAARELLEATDTLAIAAARHHLRRTLAAEGKGGRE